MFPGTLEWFSVIVIKQRLPDNGDGDGDDSLLKRCICETIGNRENRFGLNGLFCSLHVQEFQFFLLVIFH